MRVPEMVYDQPKGCIHRKAGRFQGQACVRKSSNHLKIHYRKFDHAMVPLAYTLLLREGIWAWEVSLPGFGMSSRKGVSER